MPTVFIPTQMRELTGGVSQFVVAARTVGQAIQALDARYPGLAARLLQGYSLAPGLAVSVDGQFQPRGVQAKLAEHSEIHFLPAIGGG